LGAFQRTGTLSLTSGPNATMGVRELTRKHDSGLLNAAMAAGGEKKNTTQSGLVSRTPMRRQFGRVTGFGFGGNAGLFFVPRMRSNAMLSALSSLASGGT
jgi:hypothetical protein